jgi:hypothetical protein
VVATSVAAIELQE